MRPPRSARRSRRPETAVAERDAALVAGAAGAGRPARRPRPARRRHRCAALRHAGRGEGQHRHQRPAHHLRLPDPRGLRQPVRRDGRRAPARGGRAHRLQDEHGRVRHGLVHRALGLRPGAAPARPRARARRLVRRIRRARRRGRGACRARLRDRRLGAAAGGLLRHRRRQADLWPREPATGSSRSARRSTRCRCSAAPSTTPRACSTPSAATTRSTPPVWRCLPMGDAGPLARSQRAAHRAAARVSSRRISTPASARASIAPSPRCASWARRSSTSRCRTPATRCRPTTSSRRPRRRPTWRASTACATGCVPPGPADDVRAVYRATRGAGLRRRGPAAHPARHLRAERRLLRRVLREGAAGARADRRRLPPRVRRRAWTCCSRRPRPTPAFRAGAKLETRSRCTSRTSSSAR